MELSKLWNFRVIFFVMPMGRTEESIVELGEIGNFIIFEIMYIIHIYNKSYTVYLQQYMTWMIYF